MKLLKQVSARLFRSYPWLQRDDLESYAFLGLLQAARTFDPGRSKCFGSYAAVKGVYHAIDQMRKDGLIHRPGQQGKKPQPLKEEIVDPRGQRDLTGLQNRDQTEALLRHLDEPDRNLLMMYYGKGMTFREIAQVRNITESAVCVRHGQIIRRLRHQARMGAEASASPSHQPSTLSLGGGTDHA